MSRAWPLLALGGLFLPPLAAADEPRLLAPQGAEAQADRPETLGLGVVRARPVGLNLAALPGSDGVSPLPRPGHRLRLDAFGDVVFRARMVRAERVERGMSWVGKLEGQPLSDVVLSVYGGVLTGSVNGREGTYRIRYDGRANWVEEIDPDQFPEDDCFQEYDESELGLTSGSGEETAAGIPVVVYDNGSTIDVLVVYTPAAKAREGGSSGIRSLINTAIAETNTGYANSGVVQRLRLAGTEEVSFAEATTDIRGDLDRLTYTDGVIDDVHALRDSYQADLVALIGDGYSAAPPAGTYSCGIAWLTPGASHAFSVIDRQCATGYYSFGHELGHNMGLNHARVDPIGPGAYPYSYGYKDPGDLFRTVMAYNCPSGCPRVLRFSNPDFLYNYSGKPTGISETASDSANNALSLNNTRVTIANWRSSDPSEGSAQVTVTSPNGGESWGVGSRQTLTWTSANLTSTSSLKVWYADGHTSSLIATLSPTATSHSWTVPDDEGSGWKVTVCSDVGGVYETCEASDSSDADFSIVSAPAQSAWHSWFAVDSQETPGVGDFNGDDKTDIITFTRQNPNAVGDVYVALSDGSRFGANTKWHDWFAVSTDETVVIGDYDGDGKDDIATWLGKTTRQVYVARSLGTGMTSASVWRSSIGTDRTDVLMSGDTNGDGMEDLILFARKQGRVYVALSDGTQFGAPRVWHGFFAVSTHERPRVADVTGDGRADIVTFATNSPSAYGDVYVATSNGTRFVDLSGKANASSKWHDWFAIRPSERIRMGDLDGDGMEDFFTFLPPPFAQCYTVLSQGTSMAENVLWPEAVAPRKEDVPFVGDADGDGRADIIVFAQGEGKVYVSLAP